MTSKCLICDAEVPLVNGINAPMGKGPKKYRSSDPEVFPPVLCDRSKFALTNIQYTVLQKVLALPDGACKNELILGPYCRECFTNINNVCHCMSALENLQQSVVEFRKEFSSKILKSCGGVLETSATKRKRKSNPASDQQIQPSYSARSTILNYLNNSVFPVGSVGVVPVASSKPTKHIHEIISNMDPNTQSPETHVNAEMVVCTTNGNMPTLKRVGKVKKVRSKKMPKLSPKKKKKSGSIKPLITEPKLLTVVINNHTSCKIAKMAESEVYDEQQDHKCWCCSKIFQTDDELKKHEEAAHRKKCTVPGCIKVFYTEKSLKGHMLATHRVGTFPTTPKKSIDTRRMKKCEDCSRYYPNYKALTAHRIKEHNYKPHKDTIKNGNKVVTRPGRCKVCKKIVMDVQAHMRIQHPELPAIEPNGLHTISTRRVQRNTTTISQPITEDEDSLFIEIKTDTTDKMAIDSSNVPKTSDAEKETKVVSSKLSSPTKPTTSFNFQVPTAIIGTTLPSPTSSNQAATASSKYQFKNLLKLDTKTEKKIQFSIFK